MVTTTIENTDPSTMRNIGWQTGLTTAAAAAYYGRQHTPVGKWGANHLANNPAMSGIVGQERQSARDTITQAGKDARRGVMNEHNTKADEKAAKKIDAEKKKLKSQSPKSKLSPADKDAIKKAARKKGKDAAKKAAEEAGKKAAKKAVVSAGAKMAARMGARMGVRLAAIAAGGLIPGPGWVVSAVLAVEMVLELGIDALALLRSRNNPDINAQPHCPPYFTDHRTEWLPLTDNGHRDPTIENYDSGMRDYNHKTFAFPVEVEAWKPDTDPDELLPDLSDLGAELQDMHDKLTEVVQKAQNAYRIDERAVRNLGQQFPDVLKEMINGELPTALENLRKAASEYQYGVGAIFAHLHDINFKNRTEISNSGTSINPFTSQFWTDNVNEGKMSRLSAQDAKEAVSKLSSTADSIASVFDNWKPTGTAPKTAPASLTADDKPKKPTTPEKTKTKDDPEKPKTPSIPATPTSFNSTPGTPTKPETTKPNTSAEDALRNALKEMANNKPNTSTPQMPSSGMPSSGMPNLGNMMPQRSPNQDDKPNKKDAKEDDPADMLANRLGAPKAAAATPGKPGEKKPGEEEKPGDEMPGGPTDAGPGITMGDPENPNVAHINGKDIQFDNPKAARMASLMADASPGSPKSLEAAASEAGFVLPPPGQDIGQVVSPADLKPGDVIKNSDSNGFVYLGDDRVLDEYGQERDIADVAHFDGPGQAPFRLLDSATGIMPGGGDSSLSTADSGSSVNPSPGLDPNTVPGD